MGGTNLLEITEYSFLIESRSIGSVFVRERAAFCSVKCNIIRAERSEFRNSIFTIFGTLTTVCRFCENGEFLEKKIKVVKEQ